MRLEFGAIILVGVLTLAGCAGGSTEKVGADGYSLKDSWAATAEPAARRPVVRAALRRSSTVTNPVASRPVPVLAEPGTSAPAAPVKPANAPGGAYAAKIAGASGSPGVEAKSSTNPQISVQQVALPARRPTDAGDPNQCLKTESCRARVDELASDNSFAWLRDTPVLSDDVSGARFHALRKVRVSLSCDDLVRAQETVDGSVVRLDLIARRAGTDTSQASAAVRALDLGAQVRDELEAQRTRRCK